MKVITETADLQTGCESWSRYDFITVDLEFLREHTYYSKLCLIQIGSPGECAIIDPLAENLSLAPFFELMQNPKVTKVFHSGRQDIEIIYNLSGKIPIPVFDTQIAGMVTGYGESASYDSLVKSILNISLDKIKFCACTGESNGAGQGGYSFSPNILANAGSFNEYSEAAFATLSPAHIILPRKFFTILNLASKYSRKSRCQSKWSGAKFVHTNASGRRNFMREV